MTDPKAPIRSPEQQQDPSTRPVPGQQQHQGQTPRDPTQAPSGEGVDLEIDNGVDTGAIDPGRTGQLDDSLNR